MTFLSLPFQNRGTIFTFPSPLPHKLRCFFHNAIHSFTFSKPFLFNPLFSSNFFSVVRDVRESFSATLEQWLPNALRRAFQNLKTSNGPEAGRERRDCRLPRFGILANVGRRTLGARVAEAAKRKI